MVRLVADHNFDDRIVAGLLARQPDLDVVRVRTVGLATTPDPVVLEWAASEERVLLTHDRATMIGYANARVARGEPMSGVILVSSRYPVGPAIEDLLLLFACIGDAEWANQVRYIPL